MQKLDYSVPTELISQNSTTMILSVNSSRFAQYGEVIEGLPVQELLKTVEASTPIPQEGTVYEPSFAEVEEPVYLEALAPYFDNTPIQIGYCNGRNQTMNGMEYHKSPEVVMAVTDCLLFLCSYEHLHDFDTVKSTDAEVFYLPKGAVVRLNPLVLHLAPCMAHDKGFQAIIVLPRDSNFPLDPDEIAQRDASLQKEDRLLFKKNKWILAHPERHQLVSQHVHVGLEGENRKIHPIV